MVANLISDIWIVGDSIIHWTAKRVESLERQNLRLDYLRVNMRWKGNRGMIWNDLGSQIQWIGLHRSPAMIIVHCGGNDVVTTQIPKMRRIVSRDLKYLCQNFPDTLIVWSDILPRLTWKFAMPNCNMKALDRKRTRFNLLGHQAVNRYQNGRILKHDITTDTPGLFRPDGCHLSNVGIALFCNSIQGGIECFMKSDLKVFQ